MGLGKLKFIAVAATFALVGSSLAAVPAYAAPVKAAEPAGTLTSDISGTFTDSDGGVGTVTGTFVPSEFQVAGDSIVAVGTVTGTLTDAAGTVLGTDSTTATIPLQSAAVDPAGQTGEVQALAPSCQVLDLVLGPLDLNLLGLVVHLDRVHLNITAVPGAGDLLGNLLCALAGLLDGGIGGLLAQIVALLNQILGSLGGL